MIAQLGVQVKLQFNVHGMLSPLAGGRWFDIDCCPGQCLGTEAGQENRRAGHMAEHPPICDFGWKAQGFSLPGTDGRTWTLQDVRGGHGTLIMFICNHCPYVKSIVGRIVRDMSELQKLDIGVAAICSNDATAYPGDSFDKMKLFAQANSFSFPYLHDESQQIARKYDAVCTPDFFGFNADLELQYHGRLDESDRQAASPDARRELFEAMKMVAETGSGPADQNASMGCGIKWKAT
jgi:peroxiredoxin